MKLRSLIIVSAFVILVSSTGATQTPATQETKEAQQEAQQKLTERALKLLDETIADAATLKLPENRALVQATAGNLLWKHDERRARALLQEALANLAQMKIKFDRRNGRGEWMALQARQQVLQLVARHDPQAALDALRLMRGQPEADESGTQFEPDMNRQLEQSLLAQVAASDPKLALQLAEESLKKGVSFGVINSLIALQNNSPESAAKLVDTIVGKLRADNFATNHEAGAIAGYLLQMGAQQSGAFLYAADMPPAAMRNLPQPISEEQRRELVQTIADAAATAPIGSPIFHTLQQVMPDVGKYAPARVEQLRRKVAQFEQTLDPRQQAWNEFSTLTRAGNVEAMLAAAEKAPAEVRNQLYGAAAWKLMEKGETERARQIINDNVRDSGERKEILAGIDRQLLARAIAADKIQEARQLLARTRSKEERAKGLAGLARAALAKKDEKLARELLDEAYELIKGEAGSDEEVEAQLQVAGAFALIAPARTFDIMDSLVSRANEMLRAAAILDKFGGAPQGLFREGEVMLTSAHVGANSVFHRYLKEVKALARADFKRTETTLNAFNRDELRTMARLLLVQGILTDEKEAGRGFPYQGVMFGGF